VTVLVTDGSGAGAVAGFVVYATWLDSDGDGMSDDWEVAHGCDPAVDDARGDATGDGVANIDQFNDDTGGPYTPDPVALLSPRDGEEISTPEVTLAVRTAGDRDTDADSLVYVFELYEDAGLTSRLLSATAAAPGGRGLASVRVRVPAGGPPERGYWWRARATDGAHPGPWSQARRLWPLGSWVAPEQRLEAPRAVPAGCGCGAPGLPAPVPLVWLAIIGLRRRRRGSRSGRHPAR
jgi:hypothetical protein